VSDPRTIEFWNAPRIVSLPASFAYHRKLKPSIGKEPNCWGLKDSRTTATIGVNIHT